MNHIFKYNGNEITFANSEREEQIMVNATEMARPFGKLPHEWQRLPSTIAFFKALSNAGKSLISDNLVVTKKGSPESGGGTWFHEDVALEFARWLSPEFAIWCNDRIKELLTIGMTALPQTLEDMINNPDLVIGLATKLKEERAKVALLTPKAKLADKLLVAPECFTMGEVAKILNIPSIGRNNLFQKLRELGILMENKREPKQTFINLGYFKLKESLIRDDKHVVTQIYVTQKGIDYLIKKLNVDGIQGELL